MIIHTTCATCRGDLAGTDEAMTHHAECAPPPPDAYDQKLAQLAAQVEWITKNTPTPEQLAQFDALRLELEAREDEPPRLAAAAMTYAQWGWPVFPLRAVGTKCDGDDKCQRLGICQCPKKPASKHGCNSATTNLDRIKAYWSAYPTANVGLATGHMFDVVDIDVPKGVETWKGLKRERRLDVLVPEVHGRVTTASGGWHLYVPATGYGNKAGFMPGIDYRGKGGYVVAPPSWLGSKANQWKWTIKPSPIIRAETPR